MSHKSWLLVAVVAVWTARASQLFFYRVLDCADDEVVGQKACRSWDQNTTMFYFSSSYCFPADTYLQGVAGPLNFSQLRIGDLILGLNTHTNRIEYSPVTGWLQRDRQVSYEYTGIVTSDNETYLLSDLHNVGYQDENGTAFKFSRDLEPGEQLETLGKAKLSVQGRVQSVKKTGMYAPYTPLGNYFVYPSGYQPTQEQQPSLLLAHVLAKVHHPDRHLWKVHALMHFSHWWSADSQMTQTHWLFDDMNWLFGRDHDQSETNYHLRYYSSYSSGTYSSTSSQKQAQKINKASMSMLSLQMLMLYLI